MRWKELDGGARSARATPEMGIKPVVEEEEEDIMCFKKKLKSFRARLGLTN